MDERAVSRCNEKDISPLGIIQEITDLSAKPGATVNFGLMTKPSGNGVDGDDELEGNEEALSTYAEALSINQKRNAFRTTGRMDEKKVAYNTRSKLKAMGSVWLAEILNKDMFQKLCGANSTSGDSSLYNFANTPDAPAATRSIWANNAGADASLTADEVMDTKCLDAAKQMAELASPKIRPVNVDGKNHYVVIMHPYQATDLRKDPVWNEAQRDANVRGEKNPIFSGAMGAYNGMVVHVHEDIIAWSGGAASIPIARAILCGAQAGIIAYGAPTKWVEKSFDYDNIWGVAVGRIWGCLKPMFNSKDYGVISIATAATTASTA